MEKIGEHYPSAGQSGIFDSISSCHGPKVVGRQLKTAEALSSEKSAASPLTIAQMQALMSGDSVFSLITLSQSSLGGLPNDSGERRASLMRDFVTLE
jgi:hypothetical protein